MKRQLPLAEYQTLSRAEYNPASRGSGVPSMRVDDCIRQGLAVPYSKPGYANTNEYRITPEGQQALADSRSR